MLCQRRGMLATHLRVLYLEVLKNTGDITLAAERKWRLALKTYSPFGLNTVPSPKATMFNFSVFFEIFSLMKLTKIGNNPMRAGQKKNMFFLVMRCLNLLRRSSTTEKKHRGLRMVASLPLLLPTLQLRRRQIH